MGEGYNGGGWRGPEGPRQDGDGDGDGGRTGTGPGLRIQALFEAFGQAWCFEGSSSIRTHLRRTARRAYLFHRDGKNHSAGKTKRREVRKQEGHIPAMIRTLNNKTVIPQSHIINYWKKKNPHNLSEVGQRKEAGGF